MNNTKRLLEKKCDDHITSIESLHSNAQELAQPSDKNRIPQLLVLGNVRNSINCDGAVAKWIGKIDNTDIFHIKPRSYKILDDGSLEICDDHRHWLDRNDNETNIIQTSDITLTIICYSASDGELEIPEKAYNTQMYRPGMDIKRFIE